MVAQHRIHLVWHPFFWKNKGGWATQLYVFVLTKVSMFSSSATKCVSPATSWSGWPARAFNTVETLVYIHIYIYISWYHPWPPARQTYHCLHLALPNILTSVYSIIDNWKWNTRFHKVKHSLRNACNISMKWVSIADRAHTLFIKGHNVMHKRLDPEVQHQVGGALQPCSSEGSKLPLPTQILSVLAMQFWETFPGHIV